MEEPELEGQDTGQQEPQGVPIDDLVEQLNEPSVVSRDVPEDMDFPVFDVPEPMKLPVDDWVSQFNVREEAAPAYSDSDAFPLNREVFALNAESHYGTEQFVSPSKLRPTDDFPAQPAQQAKRSYADPSTELQSKSRLNEPEPESPTAERTSFEVPVSDWESNRSSTQQQPRVSSPISDTSVAAARDIPESPEPAIVDEWKSPFPKNAFDAETPPKLPETPVPVTDRKSVV
jgi:hypothetical protein